VFDEELYMLQRSNLTLTDINSGSCLDFEIYYEKILQKHEMKSENEDREGSPDKWLIR